MGLFGFFGKRKEEEERKVAEERQRKIDEENEARRQEQLQREAEEKRLSEQKRLEAERQRLAEEERKRKAEEEAERQRLAEEERRRKAAEEAERQRKAEEERKRRAAEEAERQRLAEEERKRLAEEERKRKAAEEEERKRKAAEEEKRKKEEEVRKLMEVYDNFASHTAVDCKVFASAGFKCDFNDMQYTAEIHPAERYLDSSCKNRDGKYVLDKNGNKQAFEYGTAISLDLKMLYNGTTCVFYPRLNIRCWFGTDYGQKTIGKMYVKIGENRYVASLSNVTTYTTHSQYGSDETDYSTLPLGMSDIAILKEIAAGKYPARIVLGDKEGHMDFSKLDIAGIKNFLYVCEQAGVFSQPELEAEANKFSVITHFNPD